MDAEGAYAQAQQLLQSGRKEAARALLADLVKAHPAHVEAWLLLATLVDSDRAVVCLQRVLALDPEHARARKWLALAQREQERQAAEVEQPNGAAGAVEEEVPPGAPGDEQGVAPRLGQYLLDFKFIRADQLKAALAAQRRARTQGEARRLGELLVEQGILTEERLNFAVREQSRGLFNPYRE